MENYFGFQVHDDSKIKYKREQSSKEKELSCKPLAPYIAWTIIKGIDLILDTHSTEYNLYGFTLNILR